MPLSPPPGVMRALELETHISLLGICHRLEQQLGIGHQHKQQKAQTKP
jgi:hypothetical protein